MINTPLLTLPVELLLRMKNYVSEDPLSLVSFSRTCHLFRDIANEDNYREIRLELKDEATLEQDLRRLQKSFKGFERHVRRLRISGCFQRPRSKLTVTVGEVEYVYHPERKKQQAKSDPIDWRDNAWMPLANLVKNLPGLEELFFTCKNRVPAWLLSALILQPRCLLHVENFSLRALTGGGDHIEGAYDSALALASSPNLHRVIVSDDFYSRTRPRIGCDDEAVFAMFTSRAPNLKDVQMLSKPGGVGISPDCWSVADFRLAQPPYRQSKRSSLNSLSISGKFLVSFEQPAEYSSLRKLNLTEVTSIKKLAKLANFQTLNLSSLQSLSLYLNPKPKAEAVEPWDETVSAFLRSLKPLRELVLKGEFGNKTRDAALEHHSQELRTLHFDHYPSRCGPGDMYFTLEQVQKLQTSCPNLFDLSLPVARTDGDATEVAVYQTLGMLKKLQSLSLELVCTDTFDHMQRGYIKCSSERSENVDLEVLFKRCAVKKLLARAIVGEIREGRTHAGRTPGTSWALRKVRISVKYPQLDRELMEFEKDEANLTADTVLRALGIPWVGTQSIRDDCEDFEFRKGDRYQKPEIPGVAIGPVHDAFRRVWPEFWKHWSRDWKSFPLEGKRTMAEWNIRP